ncbi:MAG: aspartate-semialdehyde dehydrogenase [Ignavibacteria bacterium]|nr:aspartate-semialdehyde dehydrogenase [Ignavibacteria bacterium]
MKRTRDFLRIGIVGATGLVGRTLLKVLEERELPISSIKLFATQRSQGVKLKFKGSEQVVESVDKANFRDFDVVFFSAGKDASSKLVPLAIGKGCLVIDNGSFWRLRYDVPLVVPEVNFEDALKHKGLIANPNCSTIQLVVALKPILDNFGIKKVEVSTYQAISGAGYKGLEKLLYEIRTNEVNPIISNHPIAFNILFHSIPSKYEFSEEEVKIVNETRKILHKKDFRICATCVRIPVTYGHCESVSVVTRFPFELDKLVETMVKAPGIKVVDEPEKELYPTPRLAEGTDFVYVGRIRKNPVEKNGFLMWVVADNVRKGAASNAVQILENLWNRSPDKIFKFKGMFR